MTQVVTYTQDADEAVVVTTDTTMLDVVDPTGLLQLETRVGVTETEIDTLQAAQPSYATKADYATKAELDAANALIAKLSHSQLAKVFRAGSSQIISTSSLRTKVQFNFREVDLEGVWDSLNFWFKPGIPGYYELTFCISIQIDTTESFVIVIPQKNGADIGRGNFNTAASASHWLQCSSTGSVITHLNGVSDHVEVMAYCYEPSAGLMQVLGGSDLTYMAIKLIAAD